MSARIKRFDAVSTPASAPRYELRARQHCPGDAELEVWQLPSPASPQLRGQAGLVDFRVEVRADAGLGHSKVVVPSENDLGHTQFKLGRGHAHAKTK